MNKSKVVDETCDKLLGYFVARDIKIRFNELHRALNGLNYRMSRPTLSKHLKHLVNDKMLKRNEEGTQNVSYEFNWDRFKHLREARKESETVKSYLKNKKHFHTLPLDDQVDYVNIILLIRNMHQLKFILLAILEPKNAFDYSLQYMMNQRYLQTFNNWFIQNCKENKEEIRAKALPKIEETIEKFMSVLFDRRPISNE